MQAAKPWSIAVSLRGFYDDNVNGTKHDKVDTFGFEISPSVGFGIARDQTSADASYTYSGKYYDHAPNGRSDHWDQSHIFNAGLDHRFSPRHSISVRDSFVIGQEPDVLRVLNTPTATYQRVSGDNIRNYGAIVFNTEVTELLGFELGYDNAYWNYADDQNAATDIDGAGNVIRASNSGVLDRLDNRIHLDSRWHFRPETVGIVGYQFTQTGYTGDEAIGGNINGPSVQSDDRDNRTHAIYAGVEHTFNPTLSASLKAGGQYADYYGDPNNDDDLIPFVQASLNYAYAEESSAQLGIQHQLSAANLVGATGDFVHDTSATTVYGSIVHRIMPKLFGTLLATYQLSTYNGGGPGIDGESDDFLQLGIDFMYRFNPHLSAHAGYNFDSLNSQVQEDFNRNRVYLGVTAQY